LFDASAGSGAAPVAPEPQPVTPECGL
jgi:hypothetical protein